MELSMQSQVTVAIDVLEVEAAFAGYVGDVLELIRIAAEQGGHDQAIIGACHAIEYLVWNTRDTLQRAAKGELSGPPNFAVRKEV